MQTADTGLSGYPMTGQRDAVGDCPVSNVGIPLAGMRDAMRRSETASDGGLAEGSEGRGIGLDG